MDHNVYLILALILFSAKLFGEIFRKLSMPPVLGEILAGIIIGPSLLGIVTPDTTLKLLAEIGIILLLFEVGLETDIKKLLQAGWMSAVVAIAGFILPFLLGAAVSYYIFGLDLIVSLFVGGTITATSIGITVRVLKDLKKRETLEGEIVVGAAVLDDIFGVILLAVLYEFAQAGAVNLTASMKVMIFIVAFFLIAPLAAKFLAFLLQKYHENNDLPGLLPISIFILVLLFAWLAHEVGAPEILGGFAAGLALSRRFFLPFGMALAKNTKFIQRVENEIKPLIYLFTPFFFVMVGVSMNLKAIDWGSGFIWIFSGAIILVAILSKIAGAFLLPIELKKRLIVGVAMVPRGEVGLIFAELGRINGIFDNLIYSAIVLVIIVTTIVPPFIIKWFYKDG